MAAGLWATWRQPQGGEVISSYTLLTINADNHPLMRQFHRVTDEKRSIVSVEKEAWHDWLHATPHTAHALLKPLDQRFVELPHEG